MMTCYRNLFKNLKRCYQTKANKKMSKHDFQNFANLLNFLIKKSSTTSFLYLFFTIVQNFRPKEKEKNS